MRTSDAHCDTLFNYYFNPFNSERAAWNIEKFMKSGGKLQYMAICVEPPYHADSALKMAMGSIGNFHKLKPNIINLLEKSGDFDNDKINIILSLEGASPIIDDINNLYAFYKLGVRAITLTWNHRNFVGDGVGVGGNFGLTDFGKEVIKVMNKINMIIDVSHINEAGFYDVCEISEKPIAATHSNSFTVFPHKRNLKDYQIEAIIKKEGFIGINYYSDFIGVSKNKKELVLMLIKHIEHFLSLGAENIIGIGADFDGMDDSPFEDASTYPQLAETLSKELNLSDSLIDKIMYKNLVDFTLKMI